MFVLIDICDDMEMISILPSSDKENLDRSESSFNEFNSPGPSTKLVNLQ